MGTGVGIGVAIGIAGGQGWTGSAPTGLTATVISETQIDLAWTDPVEEPDGLKVYLSTDGGANYTYNSTIAFGVENKSLTGLTVGTTYTIKLVSYKGSQESTAITDTETTSSQIGIILLDEFDSLAAGWKSDQIGDGTVSVSGGKLNFSRTGSGDFASKIYYDTFGYTQLENWEIEMVVSCAAKSTSTYGLYIGIANFTMTYKHNVLGGFNFDTTPVLPQQLSTIWDDDDHQYTSAGETPSILTNANNDRIRVKFNRTKNVFTLSSENLTNNIVGEVKAYHTWAMNSVATNVLATAGYLSIFNLGGSYTVEYLKWSSIDYKNVNFAMIGDSITTGYMASVIGNSWSHLLQNNSSKKNIILAAQASRTDEMVLATSEIIMINPKRALILVGINDFMLDTKTLAQIKTAYSNMITTIINAGITPIFLTVLPKSPESEVADLNTWINSTYGGTYTVIDIYTPLVGVAPAINATYSDDGLHPNDAGHQLIYDTIVAEIPSLL
jgi:lysophospholipase L1-like esterase